MRKGQTVEGAQKAMRELNGLTKKAFNFRAREGNYWVMSFI